MKKHILFITAITLICAYLGAFPAQAQEKEKNEPAYEYEVGGRGGLLGIGPEDKSQKKIPNPCGDVLVYNDWILSWSPKTALVYVRNPDFLDTEKSAGKTLRFGFNVGGKVDAVSGRDTLHYGIIISAEGNGPTFVPEKRSLSVDNQIVQEWGTGGGQWAVLSESAMQALFSGTSGEFDTAELGRIRFTLKDLKDFLRVADIEQQQAVTKTALGECAQTAYAQDVEQWELRGGWKVRYYSAAPNEHWQLYHNDSAWKSTISVVWADRRQDISMAQAFEEAKATRGEIDDCPSLIMAETRPEYEPFAAAKLAITKIKDPDAYAAMDKNIPIIGYEAVDDMSGPHCVLIAREFSGGAMLYALVKDDTDRLSTELVSIRNAVLHLMDDINEREAPTRSNARPVQTTTGNDSSAQCEGVQVYEDWVLSWSPKTALVYVRNPDFLDTEKSAGKTLRFGFNVGGKVEAGRGRDTLHYGIIISAEENGPTFVPEKRSLSVDNQIVQEWGTGGGQWAVLSESAMQALFSGTSGEFDTAELGRIRFTLKSLKALLRLADIEQQQAVIKTALGECAP